MTKSTGVGRGRKKGSKNVATIEREKQQEQEHSTQNRLPSALDTETTSSLPNEPSIASSSERMPSHSDSALLETDSTSIEADDAPIEPDDVPIEPDDLPIENTTSNNANVNNEEDLLATEAGDLGGSPDIQHSEDDEADTYYEASNTLDEAIEEEDETDAQEESFIEDYLEKIQKKLAEKRGGKPDIYEQGTFWYPRRMRSFALADTQNNNSAAFQEPRVFIWLPHHLTTEQLRCPDCGSKLHVDGYTKEPRARKITDLNDTFYLMTCIYRCTNSLRDLMTGTIRKHVSRGYQAEIISQLPVIVQNDFPAVLTHRAGYSKTLVSMIRSLTENGPTRISTISRRLRQLAQSQQIELPEVPVSHLAPNETSNQVDPASENTSRSNISRPIEANRESASRPQQIHPLLPRNNQFVQQPAVPYQPRPYTQQPMQYPPYALPVYFVPQPQFQYVPIAPHPPQQPVHIQQPTQQEPQQILFQSSRQPHYHHYVPPRNILPKSTNVSSSSSTITFFSADSSSRGGDRSSFDSMKRTFGDLAPRKRRSYTSSKRKRKVQNE